MLKTILSFSAAALLLTPGVQAQGHFAGGGGARAGFAGRGVRGDYGRHFGGRGGRGGRYFFFGGVPYFFPFDDFGFGFGFGYPSYAYDWGYPYPGYAPDSAAPYGYDANGAYQGSIASGPGAGGPNAPSLPTIVQQQLAKRGYYKGAVDGKFGPATKNALSRFQHQNGLQETGRIDEPTLMALGFSDHR